MGNSVIVNDNTIKLNFALPLIISPTEVKLKATAGKACKVNKEQIGVLPDVASTLAPITFQYTKKELFEGKGGTGKVTVTTTPPVAAKTSNGPTVLVEGTFTVTFTGLSPAKNLKPPPAQPPTDPSYSVPISGNAKLVSTNAKVKAA